MSDYANSRIVRMDDMDGTNWAAFGSRGADKDQFSYPAGVAVDAKGRILVADMFNDRIVRMDDMKGTNWTTLGGIENQFSHPWAVEGDAEDHVLIADMLNNRIIRLVMQEKAQTPAVTR